MTVRDLVRGYGTTCKGKYRRTGGDQEWKMRHYQPEAENSTGCGAQGRQDATHSDAFRSARMNVGIESHYNSRSIYGQNSGGYLSGIHQIVASATDVDGAADLSEKPPLRLPGDAVRKATLHLETFFPLHPRVDGGENFTLGSRDRSGRSGETGTRKLRDESALFWHVDASPFLCQRLVDRRWTQPDLVSYVEELALADEIVRFGNRTRALQLRRPGQHALERLSVE
jgi:hypothetical protein